MSVGAKTQLVLPVGLLLLTFGALSLAVASGLIWMAVRAPSGPGSGATAARPTEPAATTTGKGYPLYFKGRLDEPLSRWLWLVKWLLALPHWIVLAFLWIAYDVLTLVALVAILFTGRYPRGAVRLQRRRAALDLARRAFYALGARDRPLPAVHARAAPTTRPSSRALPRAAVPREGALQAVAAGHPALLVVAVLRSAGGPRGWARTARAAPRPA